MNNDLISALRDNVAQKQMLIDKLVDSPTRLKPKEVKVYDQK